MEKESSGRNRIFNDWHQKENETPFFTPAGKNDHGFFKPTNDQFTPNHTSNQNTIVQKKGNLPDEIQYKMESFFGMDFSDVQIHADSNEAKDLGAMAYTQGTDIHFAPGLYDPFSLSGQTLLGHELAHVQQQAEGRVEPTTDANGTPVNDDKSLEAEADNLGAKAANSSQTSVL